MMIPSEERETAPLQPPLNNAAAIATAAGSTRIPPVADGSDCNLTSVTLSTRSTTTDGSNSERRDNNFHHVKANIDGKFFRNAWRLIRIVTMDHPLYMMITEFVTVVSFTALMLSVLPIPSSYAALTEPIPYKISLSVILPFFFGSIIVQIAYYVIVDRNNNQNKQHSNSNDLWWTKEIKKRSIPLLFLFAQAYNISGFFTMLIPSLMYMALVTNPPNCVDFPSLFGQAMGYIVCVSIFKSILQFYTESTTLLWREVLTSKLHELYTKRGKAYYQLLLLFPSHDDNNNNNNNRNNSSNEKNDGANTTSKTTANANGNNAFVDGKNGIDNPDQRIAQEINFWCATLSQLLQVVAIAFFDICFYTFQLWIITDWPGPIIIFGFFVLSSIVTQISAFRVPSLLALSDHAEGDFRIVHTTLIQQAEATAMMSGGATERSALDDSFEELLTRRWRYVRRQAILNLDVYVWQYTGSIINYVAIAIAVCGGLYSHLDPAELSSLISRGSGFAISMVYGCTNLLAATVQLASLSGHTYRVIQLIDGLAEVERIAEQWKHDESDDANYDEIGSVVVNNNHDENVNEKSSNQKDKRKTVRGSMDDEYDDGNNNQLHRIKLELTTDDIPIDAASSSSSSFSLLTTLRLCVSVPQSANDPSVLVQTDESSSNNKNNHDINGGDESGDGVGSNDDNDDDNNFMIKSYRGDLPLLNSIDIDVKPKGKILIRGPPGVGKSSILRTVCRLWPMGRPSSPTTSSSSEISCIPPLWDHHSSVGATVQRRDGGGAGAGAGVVDALVYLALPQAAPFRIGVETSLFEQLTYPLVLSKKDPILRRRVKEALDIVGLPHVASKAYGLDTKHPHSKWVTMMSPGQRQLFACARIFVHRPALVLLDEATSSMPAIDEERIYKALDSHGIAYVSVGHRDSLMAHHDQIVDCFAMVDTC